MDAARKLFRAKPTPALKVDGDDVYPLFVLDDTKLYRELMLTWTFCFNDVLDAEKLHSSLSKLLEIGDWRKLGGRVRKNNGKFEIHVPPTFTPQRPAVAFTHHVLDISIDEHPVAKSIPKAPQQPSLQPGPHVFREFVVSSDTPVTVFDLLYRDSPQISLRITSFTDASLVSLVWPHTLMDALGLQALLEAWSLVLAGRESEVLAVVGAREDVALMSVGPRRASGKADEAEEDLKIAHKRVQGVWLILFGLRFLWSLFWDGPCETRSIYLPREAVTRLRGRAVEEAKAVASSADETPFISDGDVLTAWFTKLVVSSEPRQRPVTILCAFNLRFWMKSLMQSTGVYLQNLAVATFTFLSPVLAEGSLGSIALTNRQNLLEQTTQPQLRAIMRTVVNESQDGNPTFLFGQSNMLLVIVTNWEKAKIMTSADFGPAVIRPGETGATRRNPPGMMSYFYYFPMKENMMTKNVMVVSAKDHEGNYWLSGTLLPRAWAKLRLELEAML
ncbi:hypothetical protein B0T10DRAFT_501491 [Thelonectria olida]|uniref:Uncharacterized protein n=1 Tax=Thelonectria olida TaxID=1576542 RepID=A0A9P8VS35_9HYPO|nr:hypothetical protein B0T10DRAFT_501491 [Thelonectria olida]